MKGFCFMNWVMLLVFGMSNFGLIEIVMLMLIRMLQRKEGYIIFIRVVGSMWILKMLVMMLV